MNLLVSAIILLLLPSFSVHHDDNFLYSLTFNNSQSENIHFLNNNKRNTDNILIGGENKFTIISLNENDNSLENRIYYLFSEYNLENSKCYNLYSKSSCSLNYVRVVLYDTTQKLYVVCSSKKYGSLCFKYNATSNLILEVMDGKLLCPYNPTTTNYASVQHEGQTYFATPDISGTTNYGKIVSYPNKYVTKERVLGIDPQFIYTFSKEKQIFFLYNRLYITYEKNTYKYVGQLLSVEHDLSIHNDQTLTCNLKTYHNLYSKYSNIHHFSIIACAEYSYKNEFLYVGFLDNANDLLPSSSALCIFNISNNNDNNNNSIGQLLLYMTNVKIISIIELNNYIFLASRDDKNNTILFKYEIIKGKNETISLEKRQQVYLPYPVDTMNIIKNNNSKYLLFFKRNNTLLFFNDEIFKPLVTINKLKVKEMVMSSDTEKIDINIGRKNTTNITKLFLDQNKTYTQMTIQNKESVNATTITEPSHQNGMNTQMNVIVSNKEREDVNFATEPFGIPTQTTRIVEQNNHTTFVPNKMNATLLSTTKTTTTTTEFSTTTNPYWKKKVLSYYDVRNNCNDFLSMKNHNNLIIFLIFFILTKK